MRPTRPSVLVLLAALMPPAATLSAASADPTFTESHAGQFVFHLAPKALQKDPAVDVAVITEMTPDGRKLTPPNSARPTYYLSQVTGYHDEGQGFQGERPLPPDELLHRLEKALAASHYLRAAPGHPATLVIFFVWGAANALDPSASVDGALDPTGTPDLGHRNLLARAALVGGEKFAHDYEKALTREDQLKQANIRFNPGPEEVFMNRDDRTRQLVEQAKEDCFYVVASAYEGSALAHNQRKLLWRTKMTTSSRGVGMAQTLPGLIVAGEKYFGRDMTEAATLTGHLIPEGRVEVGDPVALPAKMGAQP